CIIIALYNAYKGRMDKGYAFAGKNAYLSDKIVSVKEVMDSIVNDYKRCENPAII
ncbi:MAG TPA: nitronate monooxygenase, partial [Paludibacter sp.]|nr:nitronate monooxygenase [Paludibacter sp.]